MSDFSFIDRRQKPTPVGYPWWVLPALAWFVLIIFAGVAAASFMTDDATLRTQAASTWSNLAIAVVAYWYGSSAGSTKKDEAAAATSIKQAETIAEQGKALAVSTPAAPLTVSQTIEAGPPASATATASADPQGQPVTATTTAASEPAGPKPPP